MPREVRSQEEARSEREAAAEIERGWAFGTIVRCSGARGTQINWPVAVREALRHSTGHAAQSHTDHEDVLRAIGVLMRLPFREPLSVEEANERIERGP